MATRSGHINHGRRRAGPRMVNELPAKSTKAANMFCCKMISPGNPQR